MGVPKFYRWISERYPCLSEVIKEYQMPEFDNLYLDMNGIIHVCSHPNDDDPHFRISEEKIFADICNYIEVLFRIIKPQKVFFMAVDGVAPRAKMNQQRGRRFRSAREAKVLEEEALRKGEVLPKEKRFDSNCITPGTEFMVRLQEQLQFFVKFKISTDKMWQGLRIFLSGHETPGEGEHKIMDFIRHEKSNPGYNPDTRHCLYGLDADLIMLGLCSHEPHFSLLREEVRFGGKKSQKRLNSAEQTTFHLLHLSLMREYLEHEFETLKPKLNFEYDVENIIDDWVLMGFLVGNDFIPHLPNLHIAQDALPTLYNAYMDVLPTLDGYLNEGGFLNLPRFEKYMKRLSQVDYDRFEEGYADLKWLEGKSSHNQEKAAKPNGSAFGGANLFDPLAGLGNDMDSLTFDDSSNEENLINLSLDVKHAVTLSSSSESLNDDEVFELEFQTLKRDYYMNKLNFECVTPQVLADQASGYIQAIQWILQYYYNGVASWSWFYPHHYAPYISDIKDFSQIKIEFDFSAPFLPYQQLLAVLPALSKDLLPKAYQSLMDSETSPLIEFYPNDFKTDLNGKLQEWEAVVLIPFLDEKSLIDAMKLYESNLTKTEKARNKHGPCLLYTYKEEHSGSCKSSLPSSFPDIPFDHSKLTEIDKGNFRLQPDEIKKGLCDGVNLDVYFPGFPTLKHIPHTAALKRAGVTVFQMQSRKESMILNVGYDDKQEPIDVARDLLGKTVFVSWPHMIEARVTSVSTISTSFSLANDESEGSELKVENYEENEKRLFKNQNQAVIKKHMNRLGISLEDCGMLVFAAPMIGRKYMLTSSGRISLEKQWSQHPQPYALQTLIKDIGVHSSQLQPYISIEEMFPVKSKVFMLANPHYGHQGEILSIDKSSKCKIRLKVFIPEEPDLDRVQAQQKNIADRYVPGFVVAQKLGISNHLVSRITGTMLIIPILRQHHVDGNAGNRVNIGLNLKFSKRNEEVPGYTKKSDGTWLYSFKAIDIIDEYLNKFQDLWDKLLDNVGSDIYYIDDVFPGKNGRARLQEVQDFLKGLPCTNIEKQACGSQVLDSGIIKALEAAADKVVQKSSTRIKCATISVRPKHLYKPTHKVSPMAPDEDTTVKLFDRIVNVREGYAVPLGLRGTVIGIHLGESSRDHLYDVLFDDKFTGGMVIQCSPLRAYKMPVMAFINLSYGRRKNSAAQTPAVQPNEVTKNQQFAASSMSNSRKPRSYAQVSGGDGNRRSNASTSSPDKYVRINHSPTSPFQPKNNAKFITPKVAVNSPGLKSVASTDKSSPPKPVKHSLHQPSFQGGNGEEFMKIWKSLKETNLSNTKENAQLETAAASGDKISLEHAAKSLPKVTQDTPKKKDDQVVHKSQEEAHGNDAYKKRQEEKIKAFNEQSSAALKELLNISGNQQPTEHRKKIAVEQLFKGAEAQPNLKPGGDQNSVPHPPHTKRTDYAHVGAVVELLNLLQSQHSGLPQYKFSEIGTKLVSAEVSLPNGAKFFSSPCDHKQMAADSAAAQALACLMSSKVNHKAVPQFSHSVLPSLPMANNMANHIPQPRPAFSNNMSNYRIVDGMVPSHQYGPPQGANMHVEHRMQQPLRPAMMNQPPPAFRPNFVNFGPGGNYMKWSQGAGAGLPQSNLHGQAVPNSDLIINQNRSPAKQEMNNAVNNTQSALSPLSAPFIPLQVTKKQSRTRSTSENHEMEESKPTVVNPCKGENSAPIKETNNETPLKPVVEKQSSSPLPKPPQSRLACKFSNA